MSNDQKLITIWQCEGCGAITGDLKGHNKLLSRANALACCPDNKYHELTVSTALSQPQEAVYIVGTGWQCDEMLPVGTELYTAPAKDNMAEENERLREALMQIGDENSMMDIDTAQKFACDALKKGE